TDSAYVANVAKSIEGSVLKDVSNDKLCLWLTCLYQILLHRTNPYFIVHIKAHSVFNISQEKAKAIVRACPDCQLVQPLPSAGATNPRGLESLQKWQTDVTKYPSFGKFKNIHVSIDTFSNIVFTSVHTGETAKHVCQHFSQAFSSLGVPQEIKTDNGPSYASQELATFLNDWGVWHTFGIPYSPTSQGMVERTHQTLKRILDQQKGR
ncbi:POK25 protein, partial [Prunella fulvescens]|nr:POK25 protein [Prunella fulvescens]